MATGVKQKEQRKHGAKNCHQQPAATKLGIMAAVKILIPTPKPAPFNPQAESGLPAAFPSRTTSRKISSKTAPASQQLCLACGPPAARGAEWRPLLQIFSAVSSTWVEKKTAAPASHSRRIVCLSCASAFGSRPTNGSSRISNLGLCNSAAAIASFCFIPWEYVEISAPSASRRPSTEVSFSMRSAAQAQPAPQTHQPQSVDTACRSDREEHRVIRQISEAALAFHSALAGWSAPSIRISAALKIKQAKRQL